MGVEEVFKKIFGPPKMPGRDDTLETDEEQTIRTSTYATDSSDTTLRKSVIRVGAAVTRGNAHDPVVESKIPSTLEARILFLDNGGYIFNKDVDSGAFANVYLVTSKADNKKYAVKRINRLAKSNRKFISKFLRSEIWSHAHVDHTNLIRYHHTFVSPIDLYMIIEWAASGNLLDHCQAKGKLPEQEAAKIMYQLCSGLAYMHVNDLCHRDIKIENLLLQSSDPIHVKIADFGFAKFIGPERENPATGVELEKLGADVNRCIRIGSQYNKSRSIRSKSINNIEEYLTRTFSGSLAYASPELAMGKDAYDARKADSWSSGCVMYIMIVCRMPFRDSRGNEDLVDQQRVGLRWPTKDLTISDAAKDLIESILIFDYMDRPFTDEIMKHRWFDPIRVQTQAEIDAWNTGN